MCTDAGKEAYVNCFGFQYYSSNDEQTWFEMETTRHKRRFGFARAIVTHSQHALRSADAASGQLSVLLLG